MEVKTYKIETKRFIKSIKTLWSGTVQKIEIKKFWDSHGRKVDYGTETRIGGEVEIKQVIQTWEFGSGPEDFEFWELYINGEVAEDVSDVTSYRALKTKLVVTSCIGHG